MIPEFVQQFANLLGTRLGPPLAAAVRVSNGSADQEGIVVGVHHIEPLHPDFGDLRRPEQVPSAEQPRRVVRLRCSTTVAMHGGATVLDSMEVVRQAYNAVLYALDDPEILNGSALPSAGDPGFLIEKICFDEGSFPAVVADDEPPTLAYYVDGWFWPVGVAGVTGEPIGRIRLREVTLPLEMTPAAPAFTAGSGSQTFTLRFGASGTMDSDGKDISQLPFGTVALALFSESGGPGAGVLSGGDPGATGVRLATVTAGSATIEYTPPAEAAVDELVVALDNGSGGQGVVLGRARIIVQEA